MMLVESTPIHDRVVADFAGLAAVRAAVREYETASPCRRAFLRSLMEEA